MNEEDAAALGGVELAGFPLSGADAEADDPGADEEAEAEAGTDEAPAEALAPPCDPVAETEGDGCPDGPEQPATAAAIKNIPAASIFARNGIVSIRALR